MTNINNNCRDRPAAVIAGLSLTALGVIRSLGRKGIRVIGMDYHRGQIGSYSRYCDALCCPDPEKSRNELLIFMKSLQKKIRNEAVLIPTSDDFVLFVSRNRKELESLYKFRLPSAQLIEMINDKRALYRVAEENNIPVPRTFAPKGIEDVIDISKTINYPCVIKPAYGFLYKHLHFKAIMAKNPVELLKNYRKFEKYEDNTVIQEFVSGRDDAQYSLATYFDANSDSLVTFTSRKIRQIPPSFGTGTFVENCLEPAIVKSGISFLRKLNYQGIAELEFKRDSRDGNFKMIEVNTRAWTQNNLAVRCGIDIPYIAYVDILGGKVERSLQTEKNIKWIGFYDDFLACFGSSGYFSSGEITLAKWLSSLIGKKECAIFAVDDIKPFIKSSKEFLFKLMKRVINKINKHSISRLVHFVISNLKFLFC